MVKVMKDKKTLLKLAILFGAISLVCLIILIIIKISIFNIANSGNTSEESTFFTTIFLIPISIIIFILGILMSGVNLLIGVLPMIKEKKFLMKQELIILGSTLLIIIGYIITNLV